MGRSQRHSVIIRGTDAAGKGLAEKQPAPVYIQQFLASQAFAVPVGASGGPLQGSTIAGFPPTLIPAPGLAAARDAELNAAGDFSGPGQFNISGNPIYQDLPPAGGTTPPDEGTKPELNSIDPNSAMIGDPDLTMSVNGLNFVDGSVIVFNEGDETTTFVDSGQLTTVVKPSTASVPGSYPVYVRNPDGQRTDLEGTFTFLALRTAKRSFPIGPVPISSIDEHENGIALTIAEGDVQVGDKVLVEATGNTAINGDYTVVLVDGQVVVIENDTALPTPIQAKGRLTVTG